MDVYLYISEIKIIQFNSIQYDQIYKLPAVDENKNTLALSANFWLQGLKWQVGHTFWLAQFSKEVISSYTMITGDGDTHVPDKNTDDADLPDNPNLHQCFRNHELFHQQRNARTHKQTVNVSGKSSNYSRAHVLMLFVYCHVRSSPINQWK